MNCIRDRRGIWCATFRNAKPSHNAFLDRTACDHTIIMYFESAVRLPTCKECLRVVARRRINKTSEHAKKRR